MTPLQISTIKAVIATDSQMNTQPANSDGSDVIAKLFNVVDPTYFVWRSTTAGTDINDAISWANLTPTDTPDATANYTNRALMCQAKQINLQLLLQGRDTVSSGKSNIRAGFQDALTNIPSGVGGTLQAANWVAVKTAMTRNATRMEKLLTTGAGTGATPSTLVFEGLVSYSDIDAIRNS